MVRACTTGHSQRAQDFFMKENTLHHIREAHIIEGRQIPELKDTGLP